MDEGFGCKELAARLRMLSYQVVTHQEHFNKKQGVTDEENIVLCAKNNWLLTTTDKNLVLRYRNLLHKYKQPVVFTSNNQEKFETWITALTEAKIAIERNWKKTAPSWVGRLHPTGYLEVSPLMNYTEYQTEHVKRKLRRKRK